MQEATFEFQVCSKCHGFREPATPGITRVEATRIVSTKIDPSNQSFHPITAPGRNSTIAGLVPGWTARSIISCTDCHNNNDWQTPTGIAPRGPHASRYAPILQRYYQTTDNTPESQPTTTCATSATTATSLLRDQPGTFPHNLHVVDKQAPCAACHDAHGSRQNAHLINFMTLDLNGQTVVAPSSTGQLQYASTGPNQGTCYLTCHGSDHNPKSYGGGIAARMLRKR